MKYSMEHIILDVCYLVASVLFVIGLKKLSHPDSARKGNLLAAFGMGAAILATILFHKNDAGEGIGNIGYIIVAIAVGAVIGTLSAKKVKMTDMPQMVSLFNGMGGACAALISLEEFHHFAISYDHPIGTGLSIMAGLIIGSISFSGSMIAFAKLQGIMEKSPRLPMGNVINSLVILATLGGGVYLSVSPGDAAPWVVYGLFAVSLIYGVLFVVPIGGADMPVVISLLNSFTGMAAAFGGFLYHNQVMLTGGILVGAAGTLLTIMMCRAMNRSLTSVLFSAFSVTGGASGAAGPQGTAKEMSVQDAAVLMSYSNNLVIVPGYGLAVAQAQHAIHKMAMMLEEKGVKVSYAVHPVAGRMPGHMNVLLAEANVPYEQLRDMDEINPDFPSTDVVLVVGANDVVNPAARHDKSSPIYGMPILDADKAKTVIVMKRGMNPGYAGIENELFFYPNNYMLFGDAKKSIEKLIEAIGAL